MPRVNYVKKARKDNPAVKAGEPYYWWKFRFGPKRYSKTRPARSQLTQSEFLATVWDLQDEFVVSSDNIEGDIEDLVSTLEELRDQCQDSLDNMPESLQETSDAGALLQERIENLDSAIDDLQAIDPEPDLDEINGMVQDAIGIIG
jgi:hypothetical protein